MAELPVGEECWPHFVKWPTASLDGTTGDYTVIWKEAGLGDNQLTTAAAFIMLGTLRAPAAEGD